jgi:DNA-binding NarL/FixJ family response regulator
LIRVLVSAKSAITKAGLEALVRANARFEVAGDGYRDGDLVRATRKHAPDVVLLEVSDGFPPLANHLHLSGAPALVLLVGDVNRSEARHLLQAGVRAILPSDSTEHEIIAAIEAAAAGLAVISPDILDTLLPATGDMNDSEVFSAAEPLTTRESEVLSLLAEGAGNKEIASRLQISEHTVKFHVSSILAKLGAATRTEAVTRGYKEGLILI